MDYVRSAFKCLTFCFTCKENEINQGPEPNERTHLLIDPVSNSPAVRRTNSEDYLDEYSNSLPRRDEQAALNRIVQETLTNIIDVAAMDAHTLDPQELNDRIKMYSQKLAQQWSTVQDTTNMNSGLLMDVADPIELLAAPPISNFDLNEIKTFTRDAANAIKDIKIDHKEPLVVPFRIP